MKEMLKKFEVKEFLLELWNSFERTGSINAYLLYNDLKKHLGEDKEIKIKKIDIET